MRIDVCGVGIDNVTMDEDEEVSVTNDAVVKDLDITNAN